jgi:hypothetical protein
MAPIEFGSVKSILVSWFLIGGLLLQSLAWALPAERMDQAERLAHALAHAIDHGHHQHDTLGHDDLGAALPTEASHKNQVDHAPHHVHASEGGQFQGLPVAAALPPSALPRSAPRARSAVHPPSADLAGLLRPPKSRA